MVSNSSRQALRYADTALRDREELLSATMAVETTAEIKQLSLEFQAMGVQFPQPLKQQPCGARNFIVKDPDGLCFYSPDRWIESNEFTFSIERITAKP
jgi:uncharacterized glyoxalase superfamily protein PhnB